MNADLQERAGNSPQKIAGKYLPFNPGTESYGPTLLASRLPVAALAAQAKAAPSHRPAPGTQAGTRR